MSISDRLAASMWIVGMLICTLLFGSFAMVFFLGFLWGATIALAGLAIMGPVILANYLLWGRRLARRYGSPDDS